MQLGGSLRKQLRLAIQECYPTPDELRILVLESLGESLESVTPLKDMPTIVFNLIQWAIARGRVTELIQAVAVDRPQNALIRQLTQDFAFAKSVAGEVERVVLENVGFENVAQWLAKFSALRRRVCRIEPQPATEGLSGYGTGFLVGPEVVLTNFHVRQGFARPDQVVVRFDYEADSQGVTVQAGRECRLAADAWCLAESPVEKLDYALLRLAERAADDSIGTGQRRGFITPRSVELRSGDPLLILQHPSAEPLKLSIGSVQQLRASDGRVLYTANTKGGSSGSPCLSMSLETVALHHRGAQASNHGVLWSAIEADLRALNRRDLIG